MATQKELLGRFQDLLVQLEEQRQIVNQMKDQLGAIQDRLCALEAAQSAATSLPVSASPISPPTGGLDAAVASLIEEEEPVP